MTADEFLAHVRRPNRNKVDAASLAGAYDAYKRAYRCVGMMSLVGLALSASCSNLLKLAVFAAARDRDANRPMVVVEELEPKEGKDAVTRTDGGRA